jgi:hypothetical protein
MPLACRVASAGASAEEGPVLHRIRGSLRERGLSGTLEAARIVIGVATRRSFHTMKDAAHRRAGLHQDAIESGARTGAFADGTVVTAKFDAFGGRIGDILNGMRVAEALGARFRFHWPDRDLPGIRPANEVFEEAFLRDHLVIDAPLGNHTVVRCWRLEHLAALRRGGTVWYQSKHDCGEGKFNPTAQGFRFPGLMTFEEAFHRLPLHPRLAAVRDWSRSLPSFDVAVHVRRGDIFAGDLRIGGGYVDKMIPIPLLERIVERSAPEDGRVLLVGNELEPVRARLRSLGRFSIPTDFEYPAEPAADLDDLRDFCMLARARRVIAGQSIFAFIPARIGGSTLEDPETLLPDEEAATALLDFVRAHRGSPDLEVALTCEYYRWRFGGEASPEILAELHAIALEADPSNPTYVLRGVAEALRTGDGEGARAMLEDAARTELPETIVRMTRCDLDIERGVGLVNIWGGFLTAGHRETLLRSAAASPWLAFLVAAEEAASGRFVAAARTLGLAGPILDEPAVRALGALVAAPPTVIPDARGGAIMTPSAQDLGEPPRRRWTRARPA